VQEDSEEGCSALKMPIAPVELTSRFDEYVGLFSSPQDHPLADRRTLADIGTDPFSMSDSAILRSLKPNEAWLRLLARQE